MKGGARPGSGRKPRKGGPRRSFATRLDDQERTLCTEHAARAGMKPTEYARKAVTDPRVARLLAQPEPEAPDPTEPQPTPETLRIPADGAPDSTGTRYAALPIARDALRLYIARPGQPVMQVDLIASVERDGADLLIHMPDREQRSFISRTPPDELPAGL